MMRIQSRFVLIASLAVLVFSVFPVPEIRAQNPGASIQAVTQALRSGNSEKALSLAHQLVQTQPKDPRAWTLEAIVLSDMKRIDESLKAFQSALRLQPDFLPALEGAAQIEYNNHHSAAASRLLERVVRLRPGDQTAHAMLGVLSFERKDCSSAVSHFEKSSAVIHNNPVALKEFGGCLLRERHAPQAVPVFSRVLALQPADWHSRYNLAVAESQAHKYAEAVETLQPLLKEPNPNVGVLNLAASCYESEGDTIKAVAVLHQAIVLAPTDIRNYLDLGTISLDHGSFQVGIDVMNAGLQLMPNSWRLHAERGVLYIQTGDYKKATADFELANRLQPSQEMSSVARGIELIQQNRLDQSLSYVRKRLQKSPNDAVLNYLVAEILIRKGVHPGSPEYEEAVRAATHATKVKPDFVLARDDLAQLEMMAGHMQAVIDQSKLALASDPSDQTAVYHLIVAYRRAHRTTEVAALVKRLAVLSKAAQKLNDQRNRYRLVVVKPHEGDK
ncbi:MAG: tetratricopeptide repeat protein [Acidobacteriota bacterium]